MVGTPGRVEELIKNGNIVLTNCRFIVLDEADGLLQQGHGEMINRLHGRTPKVTSDGKPLQMIVCSATLHSFDVKKMAVSGRLVSLASGEKNVPICLVPILFLLIGRNILCVSPPGWILKEKILFLTPYIMPLFW